MTHGEFQILRQVGRGFVKGLCQGKGPAQEGLHPVFLPQLMGEKGTDPIAHGSQLIHIGNSLPVLLHTFQQLQKPEKCLPAVGIVLFPQVVIGIGKHGAKGRGDNLPKGLRKIWLCRFRRKAVFLYGIVEGDEGVVDAADVVLLEDLQPGFLLTQHQIALGNFAPEGGFADFGVLILRQKGDGLLQKADSPVQVGICFFLHSRQGIQLPGPVDNPKIIGIAQQGFFRLFQAFPVFFLLLQNVKFFLCLLNAAALKGKAHQGIQRHPEEIRHFGNQLQLRGGDAPLPLGNGSKGHPQSLRQLLLGQMMFFS